MIKDENIQALYDKENQFIGFFKKDVLTGKNLLYVPSEATVEKTTLIINIISNENLK